ncbi:MAG TPA: bacillithiol biosynthesis cysteine-adding enzyme BshC [Fodinibius sp.]|nr:bacillithiol biosynthesis cysteine-adding enzyme BshC [Fodinibius sp.]
MQITDCSFQQLPFSKLFKTYTSAYGKLDAFYETSPFDEAQITRRFENFDFKGDRARTVEALRAFNEPFDHHQKARNNLERLQEEDALAIVTGQQLGIYGGPLYTVLKTISTIHLAQRMEKVLERPVIPIFWLADEDHDYDEVRSMQILSRDNIQQFELPAKQQPSPAVAEMSLPAGFAQLKEEVRSALYETEFSDDLWQLLDDCFSPDETYFKAFGQFICRLFSKYGLVLAGSNHPEVKEITKSILKRSVSNAEQLKDALAEQTEQVKISYHQQVTLYDSNIFWFSDSGARLKIDHPDEDSWIVSEGESWTTDELLQQIDKTPERFSPNVFLRPILQDALLPTLGYVAGPGEVAYYAQMKSFYASFERAMPVIFPRLSGTLIEPAVDRIMGELPFEFADYSQRIEDLESTYVEHSEQVDIEALFSDWKQKVEQISESRTSAIAEVDATLEGAAGKATAVYYGELDKLKGKVYRAVKQQDQTQLNRIGKIKTHLFPENELQERLLSPIYYMNKFGVDIWDDLLASLDEEETLNRHKLFEIQP